ncbi:hypothetical protein LTR85_005686 [Meristemomyces frigidus]|nr:hypothetical protein LTR85_005686 [Meristemomyces frigidus]
MQRRRILSNTAQLFENDDNCWNRQSLYLSWYGDLPYVPSSAGGDYLDINGSPLVSHSVANATISIAIFPEMFDPVTDDWCDGVNLTAKANSTSGNATNPLGAIGKGAFMLQCQLFNTTYGTDFKYVNGEQSIEINPAGKDFDESSLTFSIGGQKLHLDSVNPDENLTDCFALDNDLSFGENLTSTKSGPCESVSSILSKLAYQGVMEAFTEILQGTVSQVTWDPDLIKNNSILRTTLIDTKELAMFNDLSSIANRTTPTTHTWPPDFESALANKSLVDVSHTSQQTYNRSLADALEEMFENYTISLMTLLHKPCAGSSAQALVTTVTSHNIYIYSMYKLWLAYGIAILLTSLAVTQGLLAIHSNGASYSMSFSTIMRSTWIAELSVNALEQDRECKHPLPQDLAKATMSLPVAAKERQSSQKSGVHAAYSHVAGSAPDDD